MPPPELTEEPDEEEWLVTYADAITLLMAFFVMLVSFSKIDLPMFEAVMAGIAQEIGMGKDQAVSSTQDVQTAIENATFEMQMEQVVEVYKDEKGIVIEMASTSFFKPGTAEIIASAVPLIQNWAGLLTQDKFKYFFVNVAGHTDDDPIHTTKFPSNWELSAARAAAVIRIMEAGKVHPFQLQVTGFGSSHPKFPNRDDTGKAIKINQEKNRRIVVHLIQMSKTEKEGLDNVLLEERLAREELKRQLDMKARQKAIQQSSGNMTAPTAPAQVSPAQMSPAQMSPAQVSPAQVSPAQGTPAPAVTLKAPVPALH